MVKLYSFKGTNILIVLNFLFISCTNDKKREINYAIKWTKDIKAKILEDASIKPDSASTQMIDSSSEVITTYKNKIRLKRVDVNPITGAVLSTSFYSKDQSFVLAKEFCALLKDQYVEVILYHQMTLGLHEFYYCNGKIKKRGLNIRGYVGEWKEYDENGDLIKATNYENINALDTLKRIKFYR
jgi:hypothetical protein